MLHPMLAAIGAFASLATDIRLLVERPPESEQISEASSGTTE
jgi:hypothetical protein